MIILKFSSTFPGNAGSSQLVYYIQKNVLTRTSLFIFFLYFSDSPEHIWEIPNDKRYGGKLKLKLRL